LVEARRQRLEMQVAHATGDLGERDWVRLGRSVLFSTEAETLTDRFHSFGLGELRDVLAEPVCGGVALARSADEDQSCRASRIVEGELQRYYAPGRVTKDDPLCYRRIVQNRDEVGGEVAEDTCPIRTLGPTVAAKIPRDNPIVGSQPSDLALPHLAAQCQTVRRDESDWPASCDGGVEFHWLLRLSCGAPNVHVDRPRRAHASQRSGPVERVVRREAASYLEASLRCRTTRMSTSRALSSMA
jgi:hypothetical protein